MILTDSDSKIVCAKFPQFRNGRNITLQAAAPGRRQSLGATERRHRYFKDIAQQILDKRKKRKTETVDRHGYDAMCMIRLNSIVQRYDGFTPGRRVPRRAPKLAIGAVGNPHFRDFTNCNDFPSTRTHGALVGFREIHRSSLERNSQGRFNLSLGSIPRELITEELFLRQSVYC